MAQSALVIVYVPHQTHAPIGEQLEHSTMDLKVAGSIPSQDIHKSIFMDNHVSIVVFFYYLDQ